MTQPPTQPQPGQQPADPNQTVLLSGGQQPYQPHGSAPSGPPVTEQPAYGQAPQTQPDYHQQQGYAQQPGYAQPQGYPQQGYPQQGASPYQGQPSGSRPVGGAAKTIAGLILLSGIVVIIGSCTTWVDAGFITRNGLDADGPITLVFGAIAAVMALPRLFGKLSLTAAIVGLVFGLLTTALAAIDILDVQDKNFDVGFGLWLVLAGGIAMSLVSLVGIIKRR